MNDAGPTEAVSIDRLRELAAGFACGSLDQEEDAEFRALLREATEREKSETSKIIDVAALFSVALPPENPSSALRAKLLSRVVPPKPTPELFDFVRAGGSGPWVPLRVPGAFAKLLSLQKDRGYAVLLGKLDPGTHYPAHQHIGPEQIYILEGELKIGEVTLRAGDFHNAKAGSSHGVNSSETGCTIMAIVATEDLDALLAR